MTAITPIQKRVRLLFGLKLALLLAAISVGLVSVNKLRSDANWVAHTHEVKSKINEIEANIYRNSAATRGFVITRDPKQAGAADQTWDAMGRLVAEVKTLTEDNPKQRELTVRLEEALKARKKIGDRILSCKSADEASRVISSDTTNENLDSIHAVYNEMIAQENLLLDQRFKRMEKTTFEADVAMPLFVVPSIILTIGLFIMVSNHNEEQQAG